MMSSLISWMAFLGFATSCANLTGFTLMNYSATFVGVLSMTMGWLLVGILVFSYLSMEKSQPLLWWSLAFIMVLTFSAVSLFKFYVFFELSLIPILVMIVSFGSQPERLSAGAYLLFYTTSVSIPYMGIILFMKMNQSTFWINKVTVSSSVMVFIMTIPFLVKMPVFGLHFWLPKAHVEANTAGSMLLAGLLLKLGSYGVARVFYVFSLSFSLTWYSVIWVVLSMLSSCLTLMQSDVKKLVAYSSVTHMTFLMVALMSSSKILIISVVLLSIAHGWAASGMFNVMGLLSQATGSRMSYLMSVETSFHWIIMFFGLFLVSNSSIPPMPSFFPEVMTVVNILHSSASMLVIFVLMSLGVCYYNSFVFITVTHMKPISPLSNLVKLTPGMVVVLLVAISLVSLLWISLF